MGAHQLRRALILGVAAALGGPGDPARAGTSLIPIPEIITDPNEGNTVGLLGVVLFTDDKDEIRYMLAPDFNFNETKGFYPTFRVFGYPTPARRYSVVLGKSTTKDQDYQAEFAERGLWDGRVFVLASAFFEKDSTERFFGFGNDSSEEDESNYTSVATVAQATPGVWLLPAVNLSYRMRIRHFTVERGQVDAFPFIGTPEAPPATRDPALRRPGTFWAHQVVLAYDSRDARDIPARGALALVYTEAADRALGSTSSFVKFGVEWRNFIPIRRGNPIVALRALADYTSGSADLPFWEQSSLGGRRTLRAFGSDRFIDFNRSLASAELRARVWERRIFGVNAALELAPFLEAGEVFDDVLDSPVSDLHLAYGVGFRGVVRPQIVGFVDVGRGSEGTAVFTGVNYPF
jgi:outer membrane protein assembly factor BamA